MLQCFLRKHAVLCKFLARTGEFFKKQVGAVAQLRRRKHLALRAKQRLIATGAADAVVLTEQCVIDQVGLCITAGGNQQKTLSRHIVTDSVKGLALDRLLPAVGTQHGKQTVGHNLDGSGHSEEIQRIAEQNHVRVKNLLLEGGDIIVRNHAGPLGPSPAGKGNPCRA